MTDFEWKIMARNSALQRTGEVDDYQKLDLNLKFNDVGTWQLDIDRRLPIAEELSQPGAGIVVTRGDTTVLSGPWIDQTHEWGQDKNTLTLAGVDDTIWCKRRLAHPQPATAAPPYSTTSEDVRTGQVTGVMFLFAQANMGSAALVPRRVPGLTMSSNTFGPSITGRGRWQNLLVLLQELAVMGTLSNGLQPGFRIVQVGDGLEFQLYQPVNRSATIQFNPDLGNLASYTYKRSAPELTYAIVGGKGEGSARTIFEKPSSDQLALWGRIENELVNASSANDAAELGQAADKALADATEQTSLSITPIDTPTQSFGVHYGLGDRVRAVLDGQHNSVAEPVKECKISLAPGKAAEISPVVGTQQASVRLLKMFRKLADYSNRLSLLERK